MTGYICEIGCCCDNCIRPCVVCGAPAEQGYVTCDKHYPLRPELTAYFEGGAPAAAAIAKYRRRTLASIRIAKHVLSAGTTAATRGGKAS